MPESIVYLFAHAVALCIALAVGYAQGKRDANRKHHVRNAATALCAGCEWSSGPVALSDAFKAARGHESANGREAHPGIVVKA